MTNDYNSQWGGLHLQDEHKPRLVQQRDTFHAHTQDQSNGLRLQQVYEPQHNKTPYKLQQDHTPQLVHQIGLGVVPPPPPPPRYRVKPSTKRLKKKKQFKLPTGTKTKWTVF